MWNQRILSVLGNQLLLLLVFVSSTQVARGESCPRNREFKYLWYRNGVNGAGQPSSQKQAETFWGATQVTDDCWVTTGYQERQQAGTFGSVTIVAPRPGCGASGEAVYGSLWMRDPDVYYPEPAVCPSCLDEFCELETGCTCPSEPGCGAVVWPGRVRAYIGVYDPIFQSGQIGMKITVSGGSTDLLGEGGPIQVLAFNHFKYDMIIPGYRDRLLPGVNGPSMLWDGRICVVVSQPIEKPVSLTLHMTWSWGDDPDDYVEYDSCYYDPPKDTVTFRPSADAHITILPNPDKCESCSNDPPLPTPDNAWYIPHRATHCADFYMPPYWPVGGYQRWAACRGDEVKLPQFSYSINASGSDVSPVEFEWVSDTVARAVVEDRVNQLLYEFRGQTLDVDGVSCSRYSQGEGMVMRFSRRWHKDESPQQMAMMMTTELQSLESEYPGWILDIDSDINSQGLPGNVHWVDRPEARTWYDYDAFGRVTKVSAGGLNRSHAAELLTYAYSRTGELTQKTGCGSCGLPVVAFAYDSRGNVTLKKDAEGRTVERTLYDYSLPMIPVTKRYAGSILRSEAIYDLAPVESRFEITKKAYVTNGQARVQVEEYESAALDNPTRVYMYTGLNGTGDQVSTDYRYELDGNGRRATTWEQSHNGVKRIAYYSYNVPTSDASYGRVTKEALAASSGGEVIVAQHGYTKVTYAGANSLVVENRTWNSRGGLSSYDYADNGQLNGQVDPEVNGESQAHGYEYDGRQRLTLEWRMNGTETGAKTSTFYAYDHADNVTRSIERYEPGNPASGITTYHSYDIFGREVLTTEPNGSALTKQYTSGGSLEWEAVLPTGSTTLALSQTKYEYDLNGRVTLQMVADAQTAFPLHTPTGWITTQYAYDEIGRKTQMVEDASRLALVTRYEYNNQDEVVKATTPGGVWTQMVRDGRGLQTMQIVGFEGSVPSQQMTTHYAYDADGNMTSMTTPAGAVTTYEYDGYGRRTKMTEN